MALRDFNPFTRRVAPSKPTPSQDLAGALNELERLADNRPELASASRTLAEVLRAAFLSPVTPGPVHVSPEILQAAWKQGIPAFRVGEAPPILDRDDLRVRALAILDAIKLDNPEAESLSSSIRDGSVSLHSWALAALLDEESPIEDRAAALDLNPVLVRSVLRITCLPVFAACSETLAEHRGEGLWTGGDCPNCGSPPAIAESRGLEQRRYWRCGVCAADWEGERLRCPFCGITDHRKLHYRFVEGQQDQYRLGICDGCGGSLKVVSTLRPLTAAGLLVAELATLHLVAGEV
ncbi:MAG: hypothetical protein NVSMB9_24080 [Isosphaeraceae bacterium]